MSPSAFPPASASDPDAPGPRSEMTFLEHLEEMRWTIAKCLGTFLVACVLIGVFLPQFAHLALWPYEYAVSGLEGEDPRANLINTSFMGVFSVILQLCVIGGLALSLPFILFFLGQFVAPGLTRREQRLLFPACAISFLLFLLGATFSFFILLPAGLKASIYFNNLLGFELLLTAASYYGIVMWSTLGVGLAFQFPLALLILIFLGLLTTRQLRAWRSYAVVIFLVVSAGVTPTPDPFTFLMLALPLQVLYEVSIIAGIWIERWKARQELAEEL